MERKVYQVLASTVQARLNCIADDSQTLARKEWISKHEDKLDAIVKHFMPSGSGFDNGTKLEDDASTGEQLIFTTAFHHMNENGMYSGWTEHQVIVTPSLQFGFRLRITGKNRNNIKEYIAETFSDALNSDANVTSG